LGVGNFGKVGTFGNSESDILPPTPQPWIWICEKDFNEDDKKVRDRCHHSGKFRGAAHNKCKCLIRKPSSSQ